MIPNIIHQIISYIQKSKKAKKIVERILLKRGEERGSLKRFYLYQIFIKEKLNHYVNMKALKYFIHPLKIDDELFESWERNLYSTICRILIKDFLNKDLVNLLLTSAKIKDSNRNPHIKALRSIMENMPNI